jgi:hypothetical protein
MKATDTVVQTNKRNTRRSPAEVVREYGPFPGVERVHGVTFDGQHVWFAKGETMAALDPASGALVLGRRVYCGGGRSGKVRAVRRPRAAAKQ